MTLIDQLEKMYKKETECSFSFLTDNNIAKTEASSLMLIFDNCKYNIADSIAFFVNSYLKCPEKYELLEKGLLDFYEYYNSICFDQNYTDFIILSAMIYLEEYRENPELEKFSKPTLPRCEHENTAFVDLVSGFNFSQFFYDLKKTNLYYLIDKSIMTCQLLKLKIKKYKLKNIKILCKDVNLINSNDFSADVEIVRAKNIFCYVPDFKNIIEKYKMLICNSGRFYFQEQSISKTLLNPIYQDIDTYFTDGWEKKTERIITENPNTLDTLVYTKIA